MPYGSIAAGEVNGIGDSLILEKAWAREWPGWLPGLRNRKLPEQKVLQTSTLIKRQEEVLCKRNNDICFVIFVTYFYFRLTAV